MATNKKNQMSIINEEDIKKAHEAFKSAYKENKKQYEEENVKIEDVVNLTKGFSGKSALFATTVILSIMIAMSPKEFMALMETTKSVYRAKLLEAMKEIMNGNLGGAREIMNTKVRIYELIEKCKQNVIKEYDEFKDNMLKLNTTELFDKAYQISAYTDLLYYFDNDGFTSEIENYFEYTSNDPEDIQKLEEFSNKNILAELYDKHFKYESLYLTTWEDINILIEYVVFNKLF